MNERWVPYKQTNGVSVYYHNQMDDPSGVGGKPQHCSSNLAQTLQSESCHNGGRRLLCTHMVACAQASCTLGHELLVIYAG